MLRFFVVYAGLLLGFSDDHERLSAYGVAALLGCLLALHRRLVGPAAALLGLKVVTLGLAGLTVAAVTEDRPWGPPAVACCVGALAHWWVAEDERRGRLRADAAWRALVMRRLESVSAGGSTELHRGGQHGVRPGLTMEPRHLRLVRPPGGVPSHSRQRTWPPYRAG